MAKPVSPETLAEAAKSRGKYKEVEKYRKKHGLTGAIGYDPKTGEYYVLPSIDEQFIAVEGRRNRIEQRYQKALHKITSRIRALMKNVTDPAQAAQIIERYVQSPDFNDVVERSVTRMVTGSAVGQKATWRAAAAESMRGRDIYLALLAETTGTPLGSVIAQIISDNSKLIKTVPQNIAIRMSQYAQEQALKGVRPEETIKAMRTMAPHLADYQLRRIARTETSKAQTALLQARAQQLGVEWYKWRSSHDERVRDAHAQMDGIYCRWADPPNPEAMFGGHDSGNGYHPGGIYNCRCVALPVVHPADFGFPARCWVHGKIVTVGNMKQLEKLQLKL